jgi:UDP-N-acetylglucosamine--N-acetylmuramyl-(pentapeptide) pyrophosphoryl-undecaprenol N-acetylglucosamine transferase
MIASAMKEPERMEAIAAAAKKTGRPDATERLADLVVAVAERRSVSEYKNNNKTGVQA